MTPTKEHLLDLYETQRLTTRKIGVILNVSKTSVIRWLNLYDIKKRPANCGLENKGLRQPTREELLDFICVKFHSYREIAEIYKVDGSAVMHWLKRFEIKPNKTWETRRNGVVPKTPTRDELVELYVKQKLPLSEIAEFYGVTIPTITPYFEKFWIKIRLAGFRGKRFICNDGHKVMSSYELRVDNWLFENNISHVYEPPIPYKTNFRSDFFAKGYHIEVWGISKSEKYKKRRTEKQNFYKLNNIPLIEINWHDFSAKANERWKRKLECALI
jgi:transposase